MPDLYTSQVHLKRLLAGQATAAFTPAPEKVLKLLDPAFFPGMGAFNEDAEGRLQCPVRGCGEWFWRLGEHLAREHRAAGGCGAIKAAIGIPKTKGLLSVRAQAASAESHATRMATIRREYGAGHFRRILDGKRNCTGRRAPSVMERNFSDTCPAQLHERVAVLARQLGRSPSARDFTAAYGESTFRTVLVVFGTWNNAKAALGLAPITGSRTPIGLVLEGLRAWHAEHGDLPSAHEIKPSNRTPWLPGYRTILGAFGVDTWDAAMRSALEHLDITSERYSPKRRAA